nr:MAG TPA: hypothetical protein [Caudoviricetes sp.]
MDFEQKYIKYMETQKNKCGIRHERIRFSKKRSLKEKR